MKGLALVSIATLCFGSSCMPHVTCPPQVVSTSQVAAAAIPWPLELPVYDHVVIVIEENKNYDEIIGNPEAPFINRLRDEGANFTQMFGEEHHSEGNYFWLLSGSNQNVRFSDSVPKSQFSTSNLGGQLIHATKFVRPFKSYSFKGYSEGLPSIGSTVCHYKPGRYARKHVPWISFADIPASSNLRFEDFPHPANYSGLPTLSFVIPNLNNDMHDGSIKAGNDWLDTNLGRYYSWAKEHNSLLIVTFDENNKTTLFGGLTDPASSNLANQNRIATIFAGDHIKPGDYPEGRGITHVNILRTLESMYELERSGAQQCKAKDAGIEDDFIIKDVFEPKR